MNGDPRATRLNALPKYVVSTTLDRVEWNNSVLLEGDVAAEVAKLKRQPGNELQVHGSAALIRTLMKHGLVDEYRLLIHPVVLGSGARLFADGTTPAALELIGTKTTSRGVVAHIYLPSGKPEYGSAAAEQEDGVVKDASLPVDGHLADGQARGLCWDSHRWGCSCLAASPAVSLRYPWPMRSARLLLT